MADIENVDELRAFLADYPNPRIYTASTIISGYAICIRPVPALFGPEIICAEDVYSSVLDEAARLRQQAKEKGPNNNQCDGCQKGHQILNGVHVNNDGYPHMACQRNRYEQAVQADKGPVVKVKTSDPGGLVRRTLESLENDP